MSCKFSLCLDCKNYLFTEENNNYICKAFPDGIPNEIFWNKTDESIECASNIKFEPIDS